MELLRFFIIQSPSMLCYEFFLSWGPVSSLSLPSVWLFYFDSNISNAAKGSTWSSMGRVLRLLVGHSHRKPFEMFRNDREFQVDYCGRLKSWFLASAVSNKVQGQFEYPALSVRGMNRPWCQTAHGSLLYGMWRIESLSTPGWIT